MERYKVRQDAEIPKKKQVAPPPTPKKVITPPENAGPKAPRNLIPNHILLIQ